MRIEPERGDFGDEGYPGLQGPDGDVGPDGYPGRSGKQRSIFFDLIFEKSDFKKKLMLKIIIKKFTKDNAHFFR